MGDFKYTKIIMWFSQNQCTDIIRLLCIGW